MPNFVGIKDKTFYVTNILHEINLEFIF